MSTALHDRRTIATIGARRSRAENRKQTSINYGGSSCQECNHFLVIRPIALRQVNSHSIWSLSVRWKTKKVKPILIFTWNDIMWSVTRRRAIEKWSNQANCEEHISDGLAMSQFEISSSLLSYFCANISRTTDGHLVACFFLHICMHNNAQNTTRILSGCVWLSHIRRLIGRLVSKPNKYQCI